MGSHSPIGEDILITAENTRQKRARLSKRQWRRVRWCVVLAGVAFVALAGACGALQATRAAQRARCGVHLKDLAVAMLNYQEAHGHLPPPALARPDGTRLLSWRVALLPPMGYRALYERFHLNEPWDSPHNRALLVEMPPEFSCPGGPRRGRGLTGYLVVVGPTSEPTSVNTPFEPGRGVDIREVTDGTANTVLVFETNCLVPWTKPEDLHWAPGGPLPGLASAHAGGANAVFADGSLRFIKNTIAAQTLRAILTINGGEVIGA
jgi:prepilin-type processing-associated H-X9-DG protein